MFRKQTRPKVLLTLILAMAVLVYACRKDLISADDLTNPAYRMDVDLARKIYSDLKKEKGALVKPMKVSGGAQIATAQSEVPENHNNRRYALFQKAYESETKNSTLVEIPIVYNQRYSVTVINPKLLANTSTADKQLMFRYSFDRFLAYKDKKSGKISTRMITYIPSIGYLKKHRNKITHNQINKLDADFSGFIEFKEWDGAPIYMLQYENGKRTRYISLKNVVPQKGMNSTKTAGKGTIGTLGDCDPIVIEIWGEQCITPGPESADVEPSCEPYLVSSFYITPVCDPPDPCRDFGICNTGDPCIDYGDCDGSNPDPNQVVDCAGVLGGSAYNSECGCIGGTTGLDVCPPARTVTDSTTNPCIKAGVVLGMQGNTTIGTMLGETFGPSNEYGGLDLEFTEGSTGTADGTCRKNGNISWVITINQNLPNAASREYILATVYHEILHAYLEASYPKDATGKFLIPHDEHQDMAEKYLVLMIGALKVNYPGISDKDAWGLAWGGLEKTPFYNDNTKLTANQRLEISEINRKHKNKSNTADRSGTYCP